MLVKYACIYRLLISLVGVGHSYIYKFITLETLISAYVSIQLNALIAAEQGICMGIMITHAYRLCISA